MSCREGEANVYQINHSILNMKALEASTSATGPTVGSHRLQLNKKLEINTEDMFISTLTALMPLKFKVKYLYH